MPGLRFIAGSGRSGTTWILDALAGVNRMRAVFEPLHPNVSRVGAHYAHRALLPDENHPDLQQFLERVSAGNRERLWSQYRCQRHFLVPSPHELRSASEIKSLGYRWRKFLREAPGHAIASARKEPLVKCIWANLMLGWLSKQCGFRIVLVVRHPGAVAESKLRNAWSANQVLDRFRCDRTLDEVTNGRYQRLLGQSLTPVQEHVAQWLIENQCAIESAPLFRITVVSYERLKLSQESEWKRIKGALGLRYVPDATTLARPSQQTSPHDSAVEWSATESPRWQRVLTNEQKTQVQALLDDAKFYHYSVSDPQPREGATLVTPTVGVGAAP